MFNLARVFSWAFLMLGLYHLITGAEIILVFINIFLYMMFGTKADTVDLQHQLDELKNGTSNVSK